MPRTRETNGMSTMWRLSAGLLMLLLALSPRLSASADSTNPSTRVALVIGNNAYSGIALENAVNDARAMASALTAAHFAVTVKTNVTRAQMRDAIESFGQKLRRPNTVGLFYFAGHGFQMNWQNFLVPVDAQLSNANDIMAQSVGVDMLIKLLDRAHNRMNIIILDACRDNPYGETTAATQKGLAQMDAPPRTLLAYATAPGSTATDGSGKNGLYTEQLLRELQRPGAQIEDVFKRVRLAVRVKSNGRQLPWESTSLEEDFWFMPDPNRVNAHDEERNFNEELKRWQRAAKSNKLKDVEEFLWQFPNGYFSELANYRLEQLLAKKPAPSLSGDSPLSAGTMHVASNFRVGDSYRFSKRDYFTNAKERQRALRVTRIEKDGIVFNDGAQILDPLGNFLKAGARLYTPNQYFGSELQLGKKWHIRMTVTDNGKKHTSDYTAKVVAREKVTVPAGTFDAFKVEGSGWILETNYRVRFIYWRSPRVRYPYVKYEIVTRNPQDKFMRSDRYELLSYLQAD